ncbi:TonB-dependent receptor [Bradyrhizobium sp. U87765 SZCCT0131]|uniref:TonB-dependent receptor n=1 Tax=unclassified Bradyrhizobium TaxID=2631580 RepID=UPI001BA80B03|nr:MULTISPECIES: TonB-dependent receptor [unclassified Bradyrhizobium]MBR1218194.1 TonB-dependent receptor [Bradyrhizobium sp. U87765 SZCCT0131]MBR1260860.1 TonB-dependent receptor [Bradyrhizobium sp. U87765 SZCCT0134]MBR1303692.1 TonB-dependent receptor [Bradyrhizobium sp. U87765 SZCCT0110]MBR1319298.1 TonB-dependent receptor [Bradyrhizobium sp. U87765 SZCCT0109]MBR1347623.1 TonB-dependent receptor [Bradyrhizobium sp. U87765 SZCCT0048]
MSRLRPRHILLGSTALAAWLAVGAGATAQEAGTAAASTATPTSATPLPGIVVSAPSPIVRRAPARTATAAGSGVRRAQAAPAARQAATPAVPPPQQEPPRGTLPIVTDQFATVTVVPNEEIRASGAATLGDLLLNKPGITGSSFAPGGSSRPIIRGLDVNRVGIVENGIGGGGVSDLGEDHFVPIDPLTTNQVEVIRGPATLRYGSQSIGGVVSASNNRIPETLPCAQPFQGYGLMPVKTPLSASSGPCVSMETRGGLSSVDDGRDGAVLLDAAGNNVAIHADGYLRTTGDYRVPTSPYRFDPDRPWNGRQANSATRSEGGSVGGSYIFDGGFLGLAVVQNNSLYGIPGIDGEQHRTRIDAHQTKIMSKGEYRPDTPFVDAIRFWVGATDYRHNELGLADPNNLGSDGVRQTFTNKEQEGRVEVQLAPFNLRFASLTTAIGVQASHQELTAGSPDDPTAQFNGLWDPNRNTRVAGYLFNEFRFSETTRAQVAGRIEHVSFNGTTPDFPADYMPDGLDRPNVQRSPHFTPKSVSVGLIQNLPWDLVASVTAQYTERAPKAAELFSRGAHDATATFDIGNPNLTIEAAKSIEVGLRRATGPLRFEATAYYTRYSGFIYRNLTGALCGEDFNSCGDGNPNNEGRLAVYAQRDATFRGGEIQVQYDVLPIAGGLFGVEGQYDIVRATFTDGSNVPRIPPQRLGGGAYWRDANWLAKVNLLHAFAQNDVSDSETSTPGYNRLRAELSYRTRIPHPGYGISEVAVGIVGDNLLNAAIRDSVSYTKDEVLLPGLNVRLFASTKW